MPVFTLSQVGRKFNNFIDQSISENNMPPPLLSKFNPQYEPKRSRSQASSISDYSDSFTDQSSVYEQSIRSNDSLYSDGGYMTGGHSTPVSLIDDGLIVSIHNL